MEKYQINSREKLKISNELENNTTQKKKQDPNNSNSTKENNKMESLDCNKYLNLNAEFNIFSTRYLRHSLKLQSTLKFMNNVDFSDKFVIAIAGNSEAYGLTHSDKNNLTIHRIMEKKLNEEFQTSNIFVINISDIGYFVNDQLMALKQINNIYPIDIAIFLSGYNELYKLDIAGELLEKNYILNKKNDLWYVPHSHSSFTKFKNDYQKCMNEDLFVTTLNFKQNNYIFEFDKYISKKYNQLKKELNKTNLEFLFFIQPFNEERLKSENITNIPVRDQIIKKNWSKIKNIQINDEKFNILKKPSKSDKFADYAHTLNITETTDQILQKIIQNYKNEIENKI